MIFQIGTALLEACVLAALSQADSYGYSITQNIKKVIEVSESTFYPVLRRLQKDNFLIAYDVPFEGRNRRYYQLTELGKNKLKEYISEWERYKKDVDKILSERSVEDE